jgi:hypothetical protein
VETPPSPIGRTIGATIILLFCAALVWAWWGAIDIVASATGKIVPNDIRKTFMEQGLEAHIFRDSPAATRCRMTGIIVSI